MSSEKAEKVQPLTSVDVVTVTNELSTVANKWHLIASVFKFSTTYIDKLKSDEDKSDQEKLGIIISDWIGGNCPCPTWYLLGNALRHASVEEGELANSIDGKYNVATGPTELTLNSGAVAGIPHPEGCGIDGCNCHEAILLLLEDSNITKFPYLKEEDQLKRCRLEFEEITMNYHSLISYSWRSFLRKKITVNMIVDYIERMSIYHSSRIYTERPVCMFATRLSEFRAKRSVDELISLLFDYISIFNFALIVDILLNVEPTSRDRREVDNFKAKFDVFLGRKVAEMPPLFVPPAKAGFSLVRFVIQKDLSAIKLEDLESFRNRISYCLRISRHILRLISLTPEGEGVVMYTYQIPSFTRNYIFPLDDQQFNDMKRERVKCLTCCLYKLVVPDPDPSDDSDIRNVRAKLADEKLQAEREAKDDLVTVSSSLKKIEPLSNASLPSSSPFSINTNKIYIPSKLEKLQGSCPYGVNYVALIPHASSKTVYMAMVLSQHATERKQKNQLVKSLVVANTKPRAHEMLEELQRVLPNLKVDLFTGAEEDSMTTKLCLNQDTVIVCTSGKLSTELDADVVKISAISLLLIDDCHYAIQSSHLETAFHRYITNKYELTDKSLPYIIGVTNNPCEYCNALDIEEMQKHLLNVAGGIDAVMGIIFTEDVTSNTYIQLPSTKPLQKPELVTKRFKFRNQKKDFIAHIEVEMSKWEFSIDMLTPHLKWSNEYSDYIQTLLQSTLTLLDSGDKDADLSRTRDRIRVLELLQCYSQALRMCTEFGCEGALAVLEGSAHTSSLQSDQLLTSAQFNSLKSMKMELESLMNKGNAILEAVEETVCTLFNSQRQKLSGILFVDSFHDAQFICDMIAKSHFLVRPVAVPRCLVAKYATDVCSEVEKVEYISEEMLKCGREGLKAFSRGESRLLLIPYAIEKDPVKIENIESDLDFLARLHKLPNSNSLSETVEVEYVITLVQAYQTKSFQDLRRDFNMCLLEAGLKSLPTAGEELKRKLLRAQDDVLFQYQARYVLPLVKRRKIKPKEPFIESIMLRCKKCKIFACHGMEVFSFFVDGGKHCVVPHYEFKIKFTTKPYFAKHKTIKRVNRLRRMFCCNCGAPWGIVCNFPTKGCELPVIKAKHFIFEMSHKYYTVKLWSDALFVVPPVTAFPKFHIHGTSMEVDSD